MRVTLLTGRESWVYIHLEVQGNPEAECPERMFVYNYRVFDRYRTPVYGFAQHKGYPTAAHLAALKTFGACPAHRQSFGPVAKALQETLQSL